MIPMQGCMYMLLTREYKSVTSAGVCVHATLYRSICMLPVQGCMYMLLVQDQISDPDKVQILWKANA